MPVPAESLLCVIEIPKGSRNKYEWDAELQAIKLDRFVSASVVYPTDYGFVPDTLAPDGDPLDVLLCVSEPTFPGCVVEARPVGVLEFSDEKGSDDHIICVPVGDPGWTDVHDVGELNAQLRNEIHHFFTVYKDLDENRHAEAGAWGGRAAALRTIAEARERFAALGRA